MRSGAAPTGRNRNPWIAALTIGMLPLAQLGCQDLPRDQAKPAVRHGNSAARELAFAPTPVGDPLSGKPWITNLAAADLDGDGRVDIVLADSQANEVRWIRQTAPLTFVEQPIGTEIGAPSHVTAADADGDGDLDLSWWPAWAF